jgi:hypothetical protein
MSDDPGRETARQDEILEVLYWLEGEGFRANATPDGIARFLVQEERLVEQSLERLRARGYVTDVGNEVRLTTLGRREAARRFADEFAPLLGQGHGECNDPTCDCHTDPAGAAECHERVQGEHRH